MTLGSFQYPIRGCFQNVYELINLRAFKSSILNKLHIFRCTDKMSCVEFQKCIFEIPLKIFYPYIERYNLYIMLKIYELLDLRAHTRFKQPTPHTHIKNKWI